MSSCVLRVAMAVTVGRVRVPGGGRDARRPRARGGGAAGVRGRRARAARRGGRRSSSSRASARGSTHRGRTAAGARLALLVAVGIGLHNLGEGLLIGTAYATGALTLGAFLVVGFALHNATEGLAIVAPIAREAPSLRRLAALGLLAGGPAVLGAWLGAAAPTPAVSAVLFGAGAGAIAQVIVQLVPSMRDGRGRARCIPAPSAACWAGWR